MSAPLLVYISTGSTAKAAGQLWCSRQGCVFSYLPAYLNDPKACALTPNLPLSTGSTAWAGLPPGIADCAPDSWGRRLLRALAAARGRAPTLSEEDYLCAVSDYAREGALRFKRASDDSFLSPAEKDAAAPALRELPALLTAAAHFAGGTAAERELTLLTAAGAALGGARPKLSVSDEKGQLCLVKLPRPTDARPAVLVEALALTLAERSGLYTEKWRLLRAGGEQVLLVRRFDRDAATRIPFISGMSLLNAQDGHSQDYSYLQLAEAIAGCSAEPETDLKELWQRILFSVLISNTDDHLRNHALLRPDTRGWRLSPLYDVNPNPEQTASQQLRLDLDSAESSVDLVMSTAPWYGLKAGEAAARLKRQREVIAAWPAVGRALGLSAAELKSLESAFKA